MRLLSLALMGSALVLAAPAYASGTGPVAHINSPSNSSDKAAGKIHSVKPGDAVDVACAALESTRGADVRVVMTLAPASGETETGYRRLMATNEKVVRNTVHFRVPETDGIENHTVHLKVYVLGDKGAQSCDAGLMKIV